jgi:hypothetical protein
MAFTEPPKKPPGQDDNEGEPPPGGGERETVLDGVEGTGDGDPVFHGHMVWAEAKLGRVSRQTPRRDLEFCKIIII